MYQCLKGLKETYKSISMLYLMHVNKGRLYDGRCVGHDVDGQGQAVGRRGLEERTPVLVPSCFRAVAGELIVLCLLKHLSSRSLEVLVRG
jgi:hypothetical protein